MAFKFLTPLRFFNATSDPASSAAGDAYYDSTNNLVRVYNGTNWVPIVAYQSTNAQTGTTYTLAAGDAGKIVEMSNISANTLSVPTNASVAFPVGTQITVMQTNTGATSIAAVTPATTTINYYSPTSAATLSVKGRWGTVTLIKRATDTWVAIGAIT